MGSCYSSYCDKSVDDSIIKNTNKDSEDFFKNYTLDNTSIVSLEGQILYGKVVDIYDGDTCTLILPFNDKPYKFNVRLAEIDTCELKSKYLINKDLGIKARDRLLELITGKININSKKDIKELLNTNNYILNVKCGKYDKYGRLLCWLYEKDKLNNLSFNQILVNEKLAYNYNGKKKLTEEEQVKLLS